MIRNYVIAATEIAVGELVICEGDVSGRIVARFPRTYEGYAAALAWDDDDENTK